MRVLSLDLSHESQYLLGVVAPLPPTCHHFEMDHSSPWTPPIPKMWTTGLWVILIIFALAACTSSAKPGETSKGLTAEGSKDPVSEVTITACANGALGDVQIKGTAKNDTSKRSDFLIDLAITDQSGATQLGTGNAVAQNVEPGQTALWDGFTTAKWQPGIVCKVSTVSRTASL
jgi:hypothetical protein